MDITRRICPCAEGNKTIAAKMIHKPFSHLASAGISGAKKEYAFLIWHWSALQLIIKIIT
jgi:hypothetical protein